MNYILLIAVILIIALVVYYYIVEKNKYENPIYNEHLTTIDLFFETLEQLNDFVTWVQSDAIKKQFSAVGSYFKNKSTFYKKEEKVKRFNEIYHNFESYIHQYNTSYVKSQKEKLQLYFKIKVKFSERYIKQFCN